ncbi:hypothetical protein Tco_1296823 [Tanacetum coccineum]
MGGSSSQRHTDLVMSPINAFPIEDLYTPEFSESLQKNTGYWQEPNPHEYPVEQVATSPTKMKKPTRNRQKRTIQSDDAPRQTAWTTEEEIALAKGWVAVSENSKHGNARKQDGFWCESGDASINLNTNAGDNNEDEVHEIRRPGGRDKARAAGKNKGLKASGSSTMNDNAFARLMVTKMTTQEKEECLAFIEIKKREVECREREVAA